MLSRLTVIQMLLPVKARIYGVYVLLVLFICHYAKRLAGIIILSKHTEVIENTRLSGGQKRRIFHTWITRFSRFPDCCLIIRRVSMRCFPIILNNSFFRLVKLTLTINIFTHKSLCFGRRFSRTEHRYADSIVDIFFTLNLRRVRYFIFIWFWHGVTHQSTRNYSQQYRTHRCIVRR